MDISLQTLIKLEAEARAKCFIHKKKAKEEKELADFYYKQIKELDRKNGLAQATKL